MNELLDKVAQNWGLEDPMTVEVFRMAERGETIDTIAELIDLVNGSRATDWGFDEVEG